MAYQEKHRTTSREERRERISFLRRRIWGNSIATQHFAAASMYGSVAMSGGLRHAVTDNLSRQAAALAAFEMASGLAALAMWRGDE